MISSLAHLQDSATVLDDHAGPALPSPHDPSLVVLAVPLHIWGACIPKLALRQAVTVYHPSAGNLPDASTFLRSPKSCRMHALLPTAFAFCASLRIHRCIMCSTSVIMTSIHAYIPVPLSREFPPVGDSIPCSWRRQWRVTVLQWQTANAPLATSVWNTLQFITCRDFTVRWKVHSSMCLWLHCQKLTMGWW